MLYPSINDLLTIIDNRYTLVVAVSKRAREVIEGSEALVRTKEIKPVSIAVQELSEFKIGYRPITAAELLAIQIEEKAELEKNREKE